MQLKQVEERSKAVTAKERAVCVERLRLDDLRKSLEDRERKFREYSKRIEEQGEDLQLKRKLVQLQISGLQLSEQQVKVRSSFHMASTNRPHMDVSMWQKVSTLYSFTQYFYTEKITIYKCSSWRVVFRLRLVDLFMFKFRCGRNKWRRERKSVQRTVRGWRSRVSNSSSRTKSSLNYCRQRHR